MKNSSARIRLACLLAALVVSLAPSGARSQLPSEADFRNDTGRLRTLSTAGPFDLSNPFFQSLGTNGRSCVMCHVPFDGWSLTPRTARWLFDGTDGTFPLFRTNDGSVSPDADVSTVDARRAAYALLLSRGLIRIGMTPPANAEFVVEAVDDPYGYANPTRLSLFRRPLPTTNLKFLSTVMWDGRETFDGQALHFDLAHQANGATIGHEQAADALTPEEQAAIVDFELSVFTAQVHDDEAGELNAAGARGGPRALADQDFFLGVNSGSGASPLVFDPFDAWTRSTPASGRLQEARQAVAIGQDIFNNRKFGAQGFTCSGCHNAPNAGSHSTTAFVDLGLAGEAFRPSSPALPLYTLRCTATNAIVRTTDPGRAMVTGRCADIGRFKVPTLRGLAARPPYFHNGHAATLNDVVLFYDRLFNIGLRASQKDALVAFLRSL